MKLITKKNTPISVIKKLFGKLKKKDVQGSSPDSIPTQEKKKPKKKKIIIALCVVAVIAVFIVIKSMGSSNVGNLSGTTYTTATAEKLDITKKLSGSGTLKPANSYSVTSLTSGEILSADFEEGDIVEKGDVLYKIDTADAETNITNAKLNIERCQLSYNNLLKNQNNLNVASPAAGAITELNVKVGDTVQSGASIGTVRNSATMSLCVPFNSIDVDSFYVGESATITLDSTFETLNGTVTKISSTEKVLPGNMLVKDVTIEVTNPGGITDTTVGTAKVGEVACNSGAAFEYKSSTAITAKTTGQVASILCNEGDAVSKGTVILKLDSDSVSETITSAALSLKEAQNSMADKEKALENYTITSPIAGTIITKTSKAGDKLNTNSSATSPMCVIYDLSYLTMDMNVDELDINQVSVGQKVSITADAAEGKTFTGIVTKVNISGTTTNGVTAYPVTVQIDKTDGLLPGMNVNAEIVMESVTGVLGIPVNAVSRGNQVLVKKASSDNTAENTQGILTAGASGIPDGYEYVQVTLGINNDNYIEIKDGLKEGDIVAVENLVFGNGMVYSDNSNGGGGEEPPADDGDGAPAEG